MRNLAVIPARSGSKGLKDKNIKLMNGIPLMAYSIKAAEEADIFSEIMVSTDSPLYAETARQYGAAVPFLRSGHLSSDQAGSWEVVQEVLWGYRKAEREFDTVCLLQPTSPLRNRKDIVGGYRLLEERKADAVTAVCEVDHSPVWTMTLPTDGSLKTFRQQCTEVPRQRLPKFYRINGALYIRRLAYTQRDIIILEKEEYAYIMEKEHSIDIDTWDDFRYAEFIAGGGKA